MHASSINGIAVRPDGTVAVWGGDEVEQLGDGPGQNTPPGTAHTPAVPPAKLAVGAGYVLTLDGEIWWWGRYDIPGTGGVFSTWPVLFVMPEPAIDVDTPSTGGHACAVGASGAVYCWGENGSGQLGTGDTESRAEPTPVGLPGPAASVRVSSSTSCALLADGTVHCWGLRWVDSGSYEALTPELLPDLPPSTELRVGGGGGCAFNPGEQLWCWGLGPVGETRAPHAVALFDDVLDIAHVAGWRYAFLRSDHTLWMRGSDVYCDDNTPIGWEIIEFERCCGPEELCVEP